MHPYPDNRMPSTAPLSASPQVSIVTASYNYERYIGETVESILAQSFDDWELIVVDDGSMDGSCALVERYAAQDARIRLLRHPDGKNHGLAATLSLGVGAARGGWTTFLESDDTWTPDCLQQRMRVLERTGADIVFNHIELNPMPGSNPAGYAELIRRTHNKFRGKNSRFGLPVSLLAQSDIPTFSCAMLRTSLLRRLDFAPPVTRWLDWWLWMQAAQYGRFAYVPEACTRWRIHEASYNRKRGLGEYLCDARTMWAGVKNSEWAATAPLTPGARLLLRLPFFVPWALRLGSMLRYSGVSGTLRRVQDKFAQRKLPPESSGS